ncbi:conserved hypothetical protein [Microbacterium sp. 8M]|uniref:hypothetical protein n=1 Tax=Microbacterium sp. 8M TaxID=2653153 RepID=UPI0012F003F4|nr:hypothetical protein [Microbacterium sp. 8M]VXB72606.1 conserved hypothetical protein [Microbacterium sp. 8M]
MPDEDLPMDRADTTGVAHGDHLDGADVRAFDLSSLFVHDERETAEDLRHDYVGELFGAVGADASTAEAAITAAEKALAANAAGTAGDSGSTASAPTGGSAAPAPMPTSGTAPAATLPAPTDPSGPVDTLDLHAQSPTAPIDTAEAHLFDDAAAEAHPYTHSFPAPVPARPEPLHAAPRYGLGRAQAIAMAAGLVVTAIGVGWALATPTPPVALAASAAPTVDPARVAKVDDSITELDAAISAARTRADSFTAPLAAMAGSSDEPARLAADAARQAYVAALAAIKVPKPAGSSASNAVLDQRQREVAAGQASLTAATTAFRNAIIAFRQSFPAYAEAALADNPDAAEPFRTAVTEAAAAVAASDPFGPTPFAALDAWRSALAALIADQERAVAEADSRDSGTTDGSGGSGGSDDTGTSTGGGTTSEPTSTPPAESTQPPAVTDPPVVVDSTTPPTL